MVKAVMTEDYYGDLHIAPTADLAEIKKQFKKLALAYHPDRNPGRESEVTAQFQRISNAHEVLCDPQERAKYDANRRPVGRYQTGGNQRGNPYSGVSSQFPKPPTRANARQPPPPPPPSAGAQRYKEFTTPKQSAYAASQEGPEARKNTYQAWENMAKNNHRPAPTAQKSPNLPPKNKSSYDREDVGSFRHAFSPRSRGSSKPAPSASPNPERRDPNFGSSSRRTGFTPNTPNGDEAAAPKGAYFTARKSAQPPPPPPRPQAQQATSGNSDIPADPLHSFRDNKPEKPDVRFDTRYSTPYSTHGGEKLNPFENGIREERLDPQDVPNLNRSKSSRETRNSTGRNSSSPNIPRAGSDSNLNSPSQQKPFHQRRSTSKPLSKNTLDTDSSSSDDGPEINVNSRFNRDSRPYAKPRSAKTATNTESPPLHPPGSQQVPNGKPSKTPFRASPWGQWLQEVYDRKATLTHPARADIPSARSGQANTRTPNGEPSMYAQAGSQIPLASPKPSFQPRKNSLNRSSSVGVKLPTVSEQISSEDFFVPKPPARLNIERNVFEFPVDVNRFGSKTRASAVPPSGAAGPARLFEMEQRTYSVLDKLVNNKNKETRVFSKSDFGMPLISSLSIDSSAPKRERMSPANSIEASTLAGSPSKKQKAPNPESRDESVDAACNHWQSEYSILSTANSFGAHSFTIPVDETTFQRSPFVHNSTDSINTKFTADEWNGKFEGNDFFQPEQKAARMGQRPRTRTESGSRSRGRSPIKARPVDSRYDQSNTEPLIPVGSPSGTNTFSPQEWAGTFKQQTFMPAPGTAAKTPLRSTRKARGSIPKPTMGGTAALVDESDSGDEKPLFAGRKFSSGPMPSSPDAMDVDTPPAAKPSTPPIPPTVPPKLHPEPVSPQKRPAVTSREPSPTDAELKVDFEDLNVRDLISSMNLPAAPNAPKVPKPADSMSRPTVEDYQSYLVGFEKYMAEWDLYTSRIILHLFARKNQNDGLGSRRWLEDGCLDQYRLGLREDKIVLNHMMASQEQHGLTVKEHAILKEKMRSLDAERPRKKQY